MSKPYIQWRAVFRYLPLLPPQSYLYVMYITYLLTSQSKSQCEDIFLPAITFRYHSFNMTYVLSKEVEYSCFMKQCTQLTGGDIV